MGWGECISQWPEAALAVKVLVERGFAPLLTGRKLLDIRGLWELMRSHSGWYGKDGIANFAISAIDIALHDLKGKVLGVPVYQLLGGRVISRVRACASIIVDMDSLEQTAQEFRDYVARGYTAVKGGWGKNPATAFGLNPKRDLELVRLVREAVGKDVTYMVDVGTHVKWDIAHAIKMTRKFEEFDVFWVEEPLAPDDLDGYVRLRNATRSLIATGEKEWDFQAFKRLVEKRVADVIMPDVGKAEGITGVKQIIDMAALNNVFYNPHSWSTAINTAASLHLCASATNTIIFELKPNPNPMKDGYVYVPEGPGLGIEVKEEIVRKYLFD